MSLTRLTFCLGLLILLSGVSVFSRQDSAPLPPDAKFVGIPKGGAGMIETESHIVVYDQGRGKGKIISKNRTIDEKPEMHEFTIR